MCYPILGGILSLLGNVSVLWCLLLWQLVSQCCPSCGKVTEPGSLLQLDTHFQHISLPQIGTRIWFSMLSLTLVSRSVVHKCQTLSYLFKVLQICLAVRVSLSLVLGTYFANYLCSISTKLFELWRRPDTPIYWGDVWLPTCWADQLVTPCASFSKALIGCKVVLQMGLGFKLWG